MLQVLILGQNPDELRRIAQGSSTGVPSSTGGTATDTLAKTVTGATLGQFISDPLKRQFGFDQVNVQFGGSSLQLDACKRISPRLQGVRPGRDRLHRLVALRRIDRAARHRPARRDRRRRAHRIPHARRRDPAGLADLRARRAAFADPARVLRYSRVGLIRVTAIVVLVCAAAVVRAQRGRRADAAAGGDRSAGRHPREPRAAAQVPRPDRGRAVRPGRSDAPRRRAQGARLPADRARRSSRSAGAWCACT